MSNSETLSFGEFVRLVLDALEAAEIPYLIGGAVALAAWGEARTTRDLDLVIDLPLESMASFSRELEKRDMLVPVEVMLDLIIESRADLPINAIHMFSGYKAEFFLLKPGDAFREANFERRRLVDFGPPLGEVFVHAPEDLILNKLHFYAISHQPKHIRDIASIVLSQEDALDYDYIDAWAERLGLTVIWQEVIARIRGK
ncbi:MAG TPA: hypothetical protein ENK60_09505 [Anaerolineae bacterium]|nr:hypothetical protein [Anaerolineae bacterium]